jgi:hypothetical protein
MVKLDKLKRKSEAPVAAEPAKRARANSGASGTSKPHASEPEVAVGPPGTIPFGVNPSPFAATLGRLINGMPLYSYVHLYTVQLFQQVDVSFFWYNVNVSSPLTRTKLLCCCFGLPFLPISAALWSVKLATLSFPK